MKKKSRLRQYLGSILIATLCCALMNCFAVSKAEAKPVYYKLDLDSIGADIICDSKNVKNLERAIDGDPHTYATIYRKVKDTYQYYNDNYSDARYYKVKHNKPVYIQIDLQKEYIVDKVYVKWVRKKDFFGIPDSYSVSISNNKNYKLQGKSVGRGRYVTIKVEPPIFFNHNSDISDICIYGREK